MAQIHGDAGRYPQAEASRLFRRTCVTLGFLFAVGGFFTGALVVAGLYSMWWVFILVFGLFVLLERYWERAFDRFTRNDRLERRRYLQGADGEAVVALNLSDLPDNFHVFNSIELDGSSDMDHVVVGPSGLWCISTKSHKGIYRVDPGGHKLNGEPTDYGRASLLDAMRLRDKIGPDIAGRAPFAQAVVALPFARIEGDGFKSNPVVVNMDDLFELIMADRPRQTMTVKEVGQAVQAINRLSMRRSVAKGGGVSDDASRVA